MKNLLSIISVALILILSAGIASAKTPEEKRAKLDKMSVEVIERVCKKYPAARERLENCYAYATLSNSSIKYGFWGTDHGRGVAVNKITGEKIYVKMREVTVGLNFGAKEYDLLFIIDDETAWQRFISGNIKFGSEAVFTASDGVNGISESTASISARGVKVYQLTKKALAIELTFKGARIRPFRTLN